MNLLAVSVEVGLVAGDEGAEVAAVLGVGVEHGSMSPEFTIGAGAKVASGLGAQDSAALLCSRVHR